MLNLFNEPSSGSSREGCLPLVQSSGSWEWQSLQIWLCWCIRWPHQWAASRPLLWYRPNPERWSPMETRCKWSWCQMPTQLGVVSLLYTQRFAQMKEVTRLPTHFHPNIESGPSLLFKFSLTVLYFAHQVIWILWKIGYRVCLVHCKCTLQFLEIILKYSTTDLSILNKCPKIFRGN